RCLCAVRARKSAKCGAIRLRVAIGGNLSRPGRMARPARSSGHATRRNSGRRYSRAWRSAFCRCSIRALTSNCPRRLFWSSRGTYGSDLDGDAFEGMCENVQGENHTKDGMHMKHTNVGRHNQGIVSNVQLIHPNMSRNFGAGVKSVYSCNAAFGSFVLNAEGGIVAPDGLRVGFANNGENTGEAVYVVPSNGYGSNILYSEASTDGSTHARRWDGAKNVWVSVGKPTLYVLAAGKGVTETGN